METFPKLILSDFAQALEKAGAATSPVKASLEGLNGANAYQLYSNGLLSERIYLKASSEATGVPLFTKAVPDFTQEALSLAAERIGVTAAWMHASQIFIWADAVEAGAQRFFWTARNVFDLTQQEALRVALGNHSAQPVLFSSQQFSRLLEMAAVLGAEQEVVSGDVSLRELAEQPPVIELLNSLLTQANEVAASDVHIEAQENALVVRLRVDGVLRTIAELPFEKFAALASRVKLVSGLDIAERRLPQDGRFQQRVMGENIDFRVSTLPSTHGETIVLRLLRQTEGAPTMAKLGFDVSQNTQYQSWLKSSNGIVLVTGPTGSGKSTTLYAGLADINDGKRKIITAEDPVEYNMQGVNQIHAKADIGLSFANILRASLRQDPDVIMVGEIRDKETADIAIQAALTGHLVLSTLHTNTAAGAAIRLLEMGIEPFLVAAPLRGLQAQRLIRTLCEHCAEPSAAPDLTGLTLTVEPQEANWRKPVGCSECSGSGYSGRSVISEFISIDETLRHAIASDPTGQQFLDALQQRREKTMLDDGLLKAAQGLTTLDEVLRVSG